MRNLFGINCPVCGSADDLHLETSENGDVVYVRLGRWPDEKAQQAAADLEWSIWWNTPICCDACGYEGACETFEGEYAAWTRRVRKVMDRFHQWFPPIKRGGP